MLLKFFTDSYYKVLVETKGSWSTFKEDVFAQELLEQRSTEENRKLW